MNKILIEEPCPESWDKMRPEETGRFCDKCCKIVHDFTTKTKDEILEILRSAGREKRCIRVSDEVLSPVPVFGRPLKRSRLFLFAVLLVFGGMLFTSCKSRKSTGHYQGAPRIYDWAPKTSSPHHFPEK